MYYLGIDIGSLSCDAVLIDDTKKIVASSVVPTGAKNIEAIKRATHEVIEISGILESDIKASVSTGYGRERVSNRIAAITEITCHAKGIKEVFGKIDVLIDIGGQDSKSIRIDSNGRVIDFAMNDKCAAGTGRFLEAMARALQVDIDELSDLDHGSVGNVTLSSMCTVFAESEVVSLIADGVEVKEIVKGLNSAIASRTSSLVKRVAPELKGLSVAMSGGVARNNGVVRALKEVIETNITVYEKPDIIGALGAALFAMEKSM
ncbi:MAG: 2-hydroxyglutaryl-CoA dehydratase [Desulfobacterales bacterium]|nr:2-hydroxyglutaryl-CoA dehydratase [Desulfobacterales bacterium]